ncbi:Phosphatidylinositol 4,5-bisphosphate 3-kinase catalytic subunit alpha [Strongyloides ratti]|uniref:Phosphatidylinositol 4,5-bisphosphate 3-kinase catalytic subunit alpha n=1 Tax=Strongyloides ratti TaxID=34506 RepID=A0A090N106_STRRB|nr:Phosphatidylinositol 4,5-bisphosphate 3-kinase catalytic subunit alpha [Strongyloides ratti]CEF71603.1 Phosphatidylinositol 4,5-bisphosphate 3-kinase catalytic subunit alpha [Strongyloides ratti]
MNIPTSTNKHVHIQEPPDPFKSKKRHEEHKRKANDAKYPSHKNVERNVNYYQRFNKKSETRDFYNDIKNKTLYDNVKEMLEMLNSDYKMSDYVNLIGKYALKNNVWKNFVKYSKIKEFSLTDREYVEFDILLPDGFLITINISARATLEQLKKEVFYQANKFIFNKNLLPIQNYLFAMIAANGSKENIYDESCQLFVYKLKSPLLVLHQPSENVVEKKLEQDIGVAIGFPIDELDQKISYEAKLFRVSLFEFCVQTISERCCSGNGHYAFFEDNILELEYKLTPKIQNKLDEKNMLTRVYYRSYEDEKNELDTKCTCIDIYNVISKDKETGVVSIMTIQNLIEYSLNQLKNMGINIKEEEKDFVLQIVGKKIYLTKENIPLTSFEYIRSSFDNDNIPLLIMCRKNLIYNNLPPYVNMHVPYYVRGNRKQKEITHLHLHEDHGDIQYLWEFEDDFKFELDTAGNVSVYDSEQKIFVRVALTVGRHILAQKDSTHKSINDPRWRGYKMNLGYYMKDIPPAAQLSFALVSTVKKKNGKSENEVLGWCNLRLFDYKHRLIQGRKTLYLHNPGPQVEDNYINPSGPESMNIQKGSHSRIVVYFKDYSVKNRKIHIKYPEMSKIKQYASIIKNNPRISDEDKAIDPNFVKSEDVKKLKKYLKYLDGTQLSEDDQYYLWKHREYICTHLPNLLVVISDCKRIWKSREHVAQFYELLTRWGNISVEAAIELLDNRQRDCEVRKFAVDILDKWLDDERFKLFMMHLIQGIKYEPYYDNPLAVMLIRRALLNYQIAHHLFWLLRGELEQEIGSSESVNGKECRLTGDNNIEGKLTLPVVRCTIMLECLLRANVRHIGPVIKQVRMVNELFKISNEIKNNTSKENNTKLLQRKLKKVIHEMEYVESPLNPIILLGELCVEECRVLSSAKQPLKLVWSNCEPLARLSKKTHQIIFKNGDDLRQDMLTLQVMKIMDAFWKSMGYDFCMSIYEVLPMGYNIGLINVVQKCVTLFEIQTNEKKRSMPLSMETACINKWLRKYNDETKLYLEAVDKFTASLTGYCVATYILGIKDRHQDNIMVRKDGRMFHIDFGHILGHTKTKLGINRDRTPFILTNHFLFVITKGRCQFKNDHDIIKFRENCRKAFLILHDHSRLFISLFRMMLSMGLPECSTQEDLNYLKLSLMAGFDKDIAAIQFDNIFDEVIKSDLSTKTNWFFHSVKHM